VFDNDKQLDRFLQLKGGFENFHIDIEISVEDDRQENVLNHINDNFDEHEVELEIL